MNVCELILELTDAAGYSGNVQGRVEGIEGARAACIVPRNTGKAVYGTACLKLPGRPRRLRVRP